MADIDNFEISWQGLTHGQVEDAIKAKVAALEQLISQGSASVAELSPIVTGLRTDVNNLLASYPASKVSISGYSSLLAKLNEMDALIAQASQTGGDVDLSDYYTKTEANNTFATKTELATKQDALVAGNGIVIAQDGKTVSVAEAIRTGAGKGATALQPSDVSVETPATPDGTVDINVGSNTYTINLNHEHEGMAKLAKFVASNPPASMANDTIYAQVDNLTTPTEIQSLWLFGCEFAGGIPDTGLPQVTKPINGNVINLGALSASGTSKVIQIKARNLTNNLTVTVGTGLTVTYNGTTASSVTIPKADAILGVDVTVAYTGTAELDDGAMTISHGNDMLASYTVTVHFPSGYTACEYIQGGSNTTYINTGVNVTSELRVVGKYKYQPSVEYSAIFGMYLNDQAVYRGLTANTPCAMFFQIAGSSFGTAYRVADTNPHEFDLNKERLIFDGAEYPSETSSEWTTDRKLYLFSMNNASNNNASEGALPNASLYYFKIYNGSSLVRDFRPAYEQSTQKYGMYDLVQGLFYPSSGNGNFSGQQITQ